MEYTRDIMIDFQSDYVSNLIQETPVAADEKLFTNLPVTTHLVNQV